MVCVLPVLFLSPRVTGAQQKQNSLDALAGTLSAMLIDQGGISCAGSVAGS
jgi:hypothetical protein